MASVVSKTSSFDFRMAKTAQRGPTGVCVFGKSETKIDPGAVLMQKTNTSILNYNEDEFQHGLEENAWDADKGISYLEAAVQLPFSINLPVVTRVAPRRQVFEIFQVPLVDGDHLAAWPDMRGPERAASKASEAIKYFPFDGEKDHSNHNVLRLADYAAVHSVGVLFNTGNAVLAVPGIERYIAGIVVIPPRDFTRNMASRAATVKGAHSVDVSNSIRTQARYVNFAAKHAIPVYAGFEAIPDETGLYLAASGAGKSTYIASHRSIHGRAVYERYWEADVSTSSDIRGMSSGSYPRRLPIVPWRPTIYGGRIFPGQLPQVFPPTRFRVTEVGVPPYTVGGIYGNYSPFVHMIPCDEEDDYAFVPTGEGSWRLVDNPLLLRVRGTPVTEIAFAPRDRDFFMGLSFPAVAAHAGFGMQRQADDLMRIHIRTTSTGTGTSGHMIASVLCHDSHFLWYMHEVYVNQKTNSGVYRMPFYGQKVSEYHSPAEYIHAVKDLKVQSTQPPHRLPGYAQKRLPFLMSFLASVTAAAIES